MRTQHYFLPTLKQTPSDAEMMSHRLMLRAGLIRKLGSGLYTWLPLGLKVLNKVRKIIDEEMASVGALETLMPSVQPANLWQESDRWDTFGHLLLKISDRHQKDFCFGPTHEEVVTDLLRSDLRSYKQLPLTLYQIQTKFRDEIRPRFGVMRAREFLMKDAYSFNIDQASLADTYQAMYDAYSRIFTRLGLNFRAVVADTGSIGGSVSHEFQVLADAGEDRIAFSDSSSYAANVEMAEALSPETTTTQSGKPRQKVMADSLDQLMTKHNISAAQCIKIICVKGTTAPIVALLLRADHTLNTVKCEKLPSIASPLTVLNEKTLHSDMPCTNEFLGPLDLNIPMIADRAVTVMHDFVCGANQNQQFFRYANWEENNICPPSVDLRHVVDGDPSPDGQGKLKIQRGIEVGHIFQLGDKYSQAMNLSVLNAQGKAVHPLMGCYGIGVSRIVAATIEQHHDDQGIIWPESLAPFQVIILPINGHKSYRVKEASEQCYTSLKEQGIEVLLDDRKERPGVLFANADLMGIPHQVIIGEKGLDEDAVEYRRRGKALSKLSLAQAIAGKFLTL